jgi:uncharacterized protein DUF4129
VLMAIITAFGSWAIRHGDLPERAQEFAQQRQGQGQQEGRDGGPLVRPVPGRPADLQWPIAAAIGGLVLLGTILVAVRRRGTQPRTPFEQSVEEELVRAVETTIDDLRRERDPRRAVIAAYAHMEGVLASRGLERRRAEAPFEYLARILCDLSVRDSAVRSLTGLFEYAKFSPHEIDEKMKADAIEALLALREDLLAEQRTAA